MVSRPSRWCREGPPHWFDVVHWQPPAPPHSEHGWLVNYWHWNGDYADPDARFWLVRVANEESGKKLVDMCASIGIGLNNHPLAWEYRPNEIINITSHDVWQPTEKVENET